MVRNEEKEEAITEEEEEYIFSKEADEDLKKGAEQLAEIIKEPQKAERIQKMVELELSGEIGVLTNSNLMRGILANVGGDTDVALLISASIQRTDFVDRLPDLNISEGVSAFLKDLNLLYYRRARQAYNYSARKEDWIESNFEVSTTTDKELIISMELVKGSGEVVHIESYPRSFLNLLGDIVRMLSKQDLTDALSEEGVKDFEKDVNTLINKLKGKESEGSG